MDQSLGANLENKLEELYYRPHSPSAFSGVTQLHNEIKKTFPDSKKEDVKNWLEKQTTYALHKQRRKHFERNVVFVMRKNEYWECDLVDMRQYKSWNSQHSYLLTCIDVFSKFARVIPLKTKSAKSIIRAFEKMISVEQPEKLRYDKGKEFHNKYFRAFLKSKGIVNFATENDRLKCVVVERFHRTLKSRMFQYFTAYDTSKYIDVLQQLVDGYNSSFHRAIKMAPNEVTSENSKNVFENLYANTFFQPKPKPLFEIGDNVRIMNEGNVFRKGYKRRWTDEIYTVKSIIDRPFKKMYVLIDYTNDVLPRRYYEEEMQKVTAKTIPRIKRRFRIRKKDGKTEKLVTLRGYPSDEKVWIPLETEKRAVKKKL